MTLNCQYYKSDNAECPWVTVMLDAPLAQPYLNVLKDAAKAIIKDCVDAEDMENAVKHSDFAEQLILAIRRCTAEGGGE